jgi:hypothetical protein
MSQLITSNELERLDEFQLRSKFCQISNDLARSERVLMERPLQLASLENVERALARKMAAPKRWPGPKLG